MQVIHLIPACRSLRTFDTLTVHFSSDSPSLRGEVKFINCTIGGSVRRAGIDISNAISVTIPPRNAYYFSPSPSRSIDWRTGISAIVLVNDGYRATLDSFVSEIPTADGWTDLPADRCTAVVFSMGSRVDRPPQLFLSLRSQAYVTFSGSWPSSDPLVHLTVSATPGIDCRGTNYVPLWITLLSTTALNLDFTDGFTLEQLEIIGSGSAQYYDMTINRLVIQASGRTGYVSMGETTVNTLEAVADMGPSLSMVEIRGGTIAKVINISGQVQLNANEYVVIAEGIVVYMKARFSELSPGLYHPDMLGEFHPERVEVSFEGDMDYALYPEMAFSGDSVSSYRHLLDKIVFVTRTKRAVMGRNLYVWEMGKELNWNGIRYVRNLVIYRRYEHYQKGWIVFGVMCAVGAVMVVVWAVLVALGAREAELNRMTEWMQARE
jgi:hypothetical protein